MTLGIRDLGDHCQCCRKDGNSAFEHQQACLFRMSGAENQLPHLASWAQESQGPPPCSRRVPLEPHCMVLIVAHELNNLEYFTSLTHTLHL